MLDKKIKLIRRHKRVRAKIVGTMERPRLAVFRSNKHLYIQLINDENGKTLVSCKDTDIKNAKELGKELGQLIAKKAIEQKLEKVVFDRGGYKYHGKVKGIAEGAREGGLKF